MLIEIDKADDRQAVANILFKNGYTIRELTIKGEKGKAKKFIEYEKQGNTGTESTAREIPDDKV